jgi:tRNASer (uridine44-2'-O)-methyltransferase
MDGDQQQQSSESLRLVSLEAYNNLYHELKEKYVPKLMEVSDGFHYILK